MYWVYIIHHDTWQKYVTEVCTEYVLLGRLLTTSQKVIVERNRNPACSWNIYNWLLSPKVIVERNRNPAWSWSMQRSTHRVCTGHAQSMHRVCTEYAQSMHRACTEYAQSMHRVCTEYAHAWILLSIYWKHFSFFGEGGRVGREEAGPRILQNPTPP